MEQLGTLRKIAGRYEFVHEELGLIVRGAFVEWVLEAAAEIVAETEKLRLEGKIEELEMLSEFGEAEPIEVDGAKYEGKARFETVPQCLVSMGDLDYRWVSKAGRNDANQTMSRVHDMSLTRNNSFLVDEPQA